MTPENGYDFYIRKYSKYEIYYLNYKECFKHSKKIMNVADICKIFIKNISNFKITKKIEKKNELFENFHFF